MDKWVKGLGKGKVENDINDCITLMAKLHTIYIVFCYDSNC